MWKLIELVYALKRGLRSILCIPIGIFEFPQWNSRLICTSKEVRFFFLLALYKDKSSICDHAVVADKNVVKFLLTTRTME